MNELVKELASNGVLAVLLAIAILTIGYLFRVIENLHKEHSSDKDKLNEKISEMVRENTESSQNLAVSLQLLTEKITRGRK